MPLPRDDATHLRVQVAGTPLKQLELVVFGQSGPDQPPDLGLPTHGNQLGLRGCTRRCTGRLWSGALDSLAPLRLPPELRLTSEQFKLVCAIRALRCVRCSGLTGRGGERCTAAPLAAACQTARCSGRMPPWCAWIAGSPSRQNSAEALPRSASMVVELASPSVAAGFSEGVEGSRGLTKLLRKIQDAGSQQHKPPHTPNQQVILTLESTPPVSRGCPDQARLLRWLCGALAAPAALPQRQN